MAAGTGHWAVGAGWFWIPGVNYSPAWVAWNYTPGYCGWAPLGYYNTPCHWGYGAWGGGYAWNVVSINFINAPNVHTRIYADARLIRTFNGGPGMGRDLHALWQRSPVMVSSNEFRNPGQIQTAFRPEVHRERLVTYERQAQTTTGRTILRRDLTPPPNAGARFQSGGDQPRQPFENRGRVANEHAMAPRPHVDERRPDPAPRDRGLDARPVPTRPLDPTPRERTVEPRPRIDEQRPDPVLRERPAEPRPRPMDERRVDPVSRERGLEPRPRLEEHRPEAPMAEREPRPAPRREEAPRERPKEEKHQ